MTTIQRLFDDYASAHRIRGNRICHWIGIPLITIALLGLLARLKLSEPLGWSASLPLGIALQPDAAWILMLGAWVRYVLLDWRIAIAFGVFVVGLYFLSLVIPIGALFGMLVVGVFFQGLGHSRYEKNRPAFLRNLNHVLIGPLYLFARAIGY